MERNHDKFDGIVREKLENLKPLFQAGSWDELSQRMDEVEQMDAFDKEAGDRLEGIHVPYVASSWQILAERLALERGRIQAVLHYKAMEVSMLVLLLITASQYFPITLPTKTPNLTPSYPIASLEYEKIEQPVSSFDSKQGDTILTNVELDLSKRTNENNVVGDSYAIKTIEQVEKIDNDFVKIGQYRKGNPHTKPLESLPLVLHQVDNNIESTPHAQLRAFQGEKVVALQSPSDDFRQDDVLASLDGQAFSLLDYGNPNELLEYIRPIEDKTILRIGFMGSPDYNRVITPSQKIENGTEVSLDRYSVSYSGGISLGVEHGKWEIETGVIYAARKYQAIPTVYISGNIKDGYSALSLKNFELNTVDVPLTFRYNFFLHDKWRMYALAGGSVNLVLNANYYIVDQSAFASLDRGGSNAGISIANKPLALKNKQLTKGWIEGGNFSENATLYAHFGLGIERYMSYRWSIFTQPTYHHSLSFFNDGLGPYSDKIHNFGINMGLKVRL